MLTINGNNPATITVGNSYADLGATITGPQADLNLGIHLFIDGAPTDAVQLDTSVAGTHAIDYVVTGLSGLTSTTTHTIIVSGAANNNDVVDHLIGEPSISEDSVTDNNAHAQDQKDDPDTQPQETTIPAEHDPPPQPANDNSPTEQLPATGTE